MANTQRRFTEDECDWMRKWATVVGQTEAAKRLGVKVTAVNNWALRNGVKFRGSRRKMDHVVKMPAKPTQGDYRDVDQMMVLAEKLERGGRA
jgi:hypothetical protein